VSRRRADEGFTLVETMVALGIVGVVMASLAMFFVRSATIQHRQADLQVAAQLAAGSMDYVSELPGDNVLLGRTQAGVQNEWQAPAASTYLSSIQPAWQDPSLPVSATVQGLPTAPETIQLTSDSTPFQRWWYVGSCWQATGGGTCLAASSVLRNVPMYRVVVVITWNAPDCGTSKCQFVSTMLTESTLDDPTWQ
jgi:prepilin-type N-terminal cleavage/methylation domain-containing protein